MKDSTEILNEIQTHRDKVQELVSQGEIEEAKYESGVADALQTQLRDAIVWEKKALTDQIDNLRVIDGSVSTNSPKKSMTEIFLGPRDEFKGITPEQAKNGISAVVDEALYLPAPEVVQFGLPTTTVTEQGFLSSIPKGTAAGNLTFPRPAPSTNRLVAPSWERGLKKPPQTLTWEQAHSNTEWFAYTLPVEIPSLMDYGYLESVIETEMRNGFIRSENFYSVQGNNPSGIIGILDDLAEVPVFDATKYEGSNIIDQIAIMARIVRMRTGIRPDSVCMGPLVREQLNLMKKEDGSNEYLGIAVDDQIWSLRIYEDDYFEDFKEDGTDPTDSWVMVYSSQGAIWHTVHDVTLSAMPVGDQFLRNETTIRLEGSRMLQILDPMRFLKMKVKISEHDSSLASYVAPMPSPRDVSIVRHDLDWVDQTGISADLLGDFALSGNALYGEAFLCYVPLYGGKSGAEANKTGYFCALKVPVGTKVKKDSGSEQTVSEADCGLWGVKLGDKASGISAKKLQYTLPGEKEPHTLQIKVTVAKGNAKRQGGLVNAN